VAYFFHPAAVTDMATYPRITLHNKKDEAVKRFHPWIFSGAIKNIEGDVQEGDVVEVYSVSGEYLATGHYGMGSLAVKIFAFQPFSDLETLWQQKLQSAYQLRTTIGLTENTQTNCYRLVNAEGDGFPGLIIDWYNGTAVIQTYGIGMYAQRATIVAALQKIYGSRLQAVYDKSASVLFKSPNSDQKDQYLWGERTQEPVLESGHPFMVDWETGQKTGFFLDQREHRQLLTHFIRDQKILNTFCYSGGFSIYALKAGARLVHSVDSSAKAIDWMSQNMALNQVNTTQHAAFNADVFTFLKDCDADYDGIILDPPAFAKHLSARHQAVMAYKRLNQLAFMKLRPGGFLFTFSCSQVVSPDFFKGAVTAAAIETGRQIKVLAHLTQPGDHPISIYHPEGLYLKGLILRVD
jgi:23S rRNA (cytosine1962-C5)-methyltransferase